MSDEAEALRAENDRLTAELLRLHVGAEKQQYGQLMDRGALDAIFANVKVPRTPLRCRLGWHRRMEYDPHGPPEIECERCGKTWPSC